MHLRQDVGVIEAGIVREWHGAEGWGVIDAPSAPGGCWTHQFHLDMEGFRTLRAGQEVELTFDDRGQDGCPYRATRVVVPGVPLSKVIDRSGPSGSYRSRVTLHFDP
jgi:CspA family cold shock protein